MLRVTFIRISLVSLLLITTQAFSSVDSEKAVHGLRARIQSAKTALRTEKKLQSRIKNVQELRSYVAQELEKQRDVQKPDPQDDHYALTLIGLDEDLGTFMDGTDIEFSDEKCSGYRISLVQSYSGTATGDREPSSLPTHTRDALEFLDLLCKRS